MKRYLDFVIVMSEKEIRVRYKNALLGFLWILINPISMMFIMGFVFQFFIPVNVDNYFLFLFTGLLPWQFFSNSLIKSTPAFYYERNLIKKSKFPKEIIIVSIVLSNMFHFIVALILLILIILADKIFIDKHSFQSLIMDIYQMFIILPGIIWIGVLTGAISLITSTINVRFRDINFIIQLAVSLLFYVTPIVFTLDLLPEHVRPFFYINPLTIIIELFRYSLINIQIYSVKLGLISLVTTVIICIASILIYKKENKNFDDWL